MKPLMVLAGGLGTRLSSITRGTPKPMVDVMGEPFLSYQLRNWHMHGCREFIFLLHYGADQIRSYLKKEIQDNYSDSKCYFIIEQELLGTGGAVANAINELKLESDFLLTNADTWLSSGFVEISLVSAPSVGVVNVSDIGRYGEVKFESTGVVNSFLEKGWSSMSGWINSGLLCLSPKYFKSVPKKFSLEHDLLPLLIKQRELRALQLNVDFIDIGIPDDYEKFCNLARLNFKND